MTRSRIVAWLRVILPLAALALLSVLFMLGRSSDGESSYPYSEVAPEDQPSGTTLSALRYAGVTSDGVRVTLTAEKAAPGPQDQGTKLDNMRLTLQGSDGRAADLAAGIADLKGENIHLSYGAQMTTADGWVLTGPSFEAARDSGIVRSDTAVDVYAPFGHLTAGAMELRPVEGGSHLLDLSGGVRLVYQP